MRTSLPRTIALMAGFRPGMTELDAYLMVQNAAISELGEQVVVYGDFASGPRCETDRGGPPTSRKIERGDLFLLDYSVIVCGYRGDFTNTFAVGADPNGRTGIDWGVYGVPETFVVKGDGTIAFKFVGPMTAQSLRDVILPEIAKAMR